MTCCPRCRSRRVEERRWACRIAGVVGAVAGSVGGALPLLSGAEAGFMVGAVAGPAGAVAGTVCDAVLAGLTGGASGCLLGTRLGQALEEHVLDNLRCGACRHTFSPSDAAYSPRNSVERYGFDPDDDPSYDE